jgi:hypothetical protein
VGGWTGTARERGKPLGNLAKVPSRALADRRKSLVRLSQRHAPSELGHIGVPGLQGKLDFCTDGHRNELRAAMEKPWGC